MQSEELPRTQDERYQDVVAGFGAALERLAQGYEADAAARDDLLQNIHVALWQSLARFDGRCSLRTWVYRVAHNTAVSHVLQRSRERNRWVSLDDEIEPPQMVGRAVAAGGAHGLEQQLALQRILALIQQLNPLERQIILSYLEGLDAAAIGEITGLSPSHVATKIHRIKALLKSWFEEGGCHGQR